ncbi:hypothetical protein [Yunchengibacter salinarum]|uniref:hypothetical protein n=1 Tax=Yunchengibacter salinarum TaxID=3133399 RepID=UPI0035B689F3
MTGLSLQSGAALTTPTALADAVFAGSLVHVTEVPALRRLGARVRAILCDCFNSDNPEAAEAHMAPSVFRKASTAARKRVAEDSAVQGAWLDVLAAFGHDRETTLSDRLRLRVVPSRLAARGRRTLPLPPHRDSWGAGLDAQVNWWLPLYPLREGNTMVLWPGLFDTALPNDTAHWSFEALRADTTGDYPLLPSLTGPPPGGGRPVLIPPDTLLAFSAAHLHASHVVPDGCSRFSLDCRTLRLPDHEAGRGAPNVDRAPMTPRLEWFTPLETLRAHVRGEGRPTRAPGASAAGAAHDSMGETT